MSLWDKILLEGTKGGTKLIEKKPKLRYEVLRELVFTPEREELVKKLTPKLEEVLKTKDIKRAFIGGSFASKKPIPGDIDIFTQIKEDTPNIYDVIQEEGLHVTPMTSFTPKFSPKAEISPFTPEFRKALIKMFGGGSIKSIQPPTWTDYAKTLLKEGKKKYGKDYHWKRILGLTGGATLTGSVLEDVVNPDEAESFPLKVTKPSSKVLGKFTKTKTFSSAHEKLKGLTLQNFEENGPIVEVLKPKSGSDRYVILQDGTKVKLDTNYLEALTAAKGTSKYMSKFNYGSSKERALQIQQAQDRMRTLRGPESITSLKKWNRSQIERIAELSPDLLKDFRYVKDLETGETYYTNILYAEYLQKKGKVKIVSKVNVSKYQKKEKGR